MTEKEYIKITNLATLRAVRPILDNLTPDEVIIEDELHKITVLLARWEMSSGQRVVKKKALSPFEWACNYVIKSLQKSQVRKK